MSIICAIAGGSGAGKTTLALKVMECLGDEADHIAIDWYYRDLRDIPTAARRAVNYDHPDSLEVDYFAKHLDDLRDGVQVDAPVYEFASHTRSTDLVQVDARSVVVTDGILLLALDDVRERYDYSVFIDVPNELRLERRMRRDVAERGRDIDDVVRQWNEFVEPMHRTLVGPSMAYADRIVETDEDFDTVAEEIAVTLAQLT